MKMCEKQFGENYFGSPKIKISEKPPTFVPFKHVSYDIRFSLRFE